MKEIDHPLKKFLSEHNVVIVDPVSSARMHLANLISKLGSTRHKMAIVSNLQEAKAEIQKLKPKLILTEYNIGLDSGLDLLQNQRKEYESSDIKDSVFVLVTANASQSAVAEAAEEDVDTYLIKPYTLDNLQMALERAVAAKVSPSQYSQLIEKGKKHLFKAEYNDALRFFSHAMNEQREPTLACFYYAQTEMMKSAVESARAYYERGLSYNRIHYKCLVGLHDLLMKQKRFHEAYGVIGTIAEYFPANPKRLSSVLRLAIMTDNFADVEKYYAVFVQLPNRSEDLIKTMCSALLVTGKYFLQREERKRAVEMFDRAVVSSGGKVQYLSYIIETLVDFDRGEDADLFLMRLSKVAAESEEYQVARFLVSTVMEDDKDSISYGRKIIKEGVLHPSVHEKLISLSFRAGYREPAEELQRFALKRWPEFQDRFILAMNLPRSN